MRFPSTLPIQQREALGELVSSAERAWRDEARAADVEQPRGRPLGFSARLRVVHPGAEREELSRQATESFVVRLQLCDRSLEGDH
ncbi:hypothetical protein [Saccharopolyspora halophila]|uniref:hypothetical protein n=1 Tax=Saccharopolyspora halophila TaxID=405551 RepID=UPI0031D839A2